MNPTKNISRAHRLVQVLCVMMACFGPFGVALSEAPVSDEPKLSVVDIANRETERWSVHGQSTYITQQRNNFNSPYSGQNSLLPRYASSPPSYSLTATAFLGARLWRGAEVYYNGEMFQGNPFTGQLVGLGGFQNGELQKGASTSPIFYTSRFFIRQTVGLGGEQEQVESEANQLAGKIDKNRLVFSYGKFSALDFFDHNAYSHDPRTQFQNFAIFSMGAYGYAADPRGATYGAVVEWYQDNWIVKFARFAMPTVPNTMQLDYSLTNDFGNQLEVTRSHSIGGQPGAIRLLVFQQKANMATYQNAIEFGQLTNTTPNLLDVRMQGTRSWGYGVNFEQAINDNVGVFGRWSWNPGSTETQTLDISKSISGGVSVKGAYWSRPEDNVGIGFAINGIASSQITYLGQGGMTAFIGDGNISYKTEKILEIYYSAQIQKNVFFTLDYQRIANPAYNSARGPINFFGFRLNASF